MKLNEEKINSSNQDNLLLDQFRNSEISFWIDSSGGPEEYSKNSFYGVNPKYYIYGSLNEVNLVDCECGAITFDTLNCFEFLQEKINEEKHNKDGIFVGYFSYDLSDFFFAYFEKHESMNLRFCEPMKSNPLNINSMYSNMTDIEYLGKVEEIKEEIKKGNVYQVNLTREYSMESSELNELDLYLRLREASPNPFGCYFKTPFLSLLSSSPEEFIHIKNQNIRTRPIKGTLPPDEKNIDPKNQAENIMIVDLERNDLGKICEYGTVKASDLLRLEKYKNLNHVVSTIEGKLRPDMRLRDVFEALFPSGSITGAPKIAAMKIIDKIEPTKRGAYTGSFGYIKTTGEMNFNILIRTIFVEHKNRISKRKLSFNVGGGIVADSDPQAELEEVKLKAKGMMEALCLFS